MKKPVHLSATFVKTVKQPGYYGDGRGGHGLALLVKESSRGVTKSWTQRLRIDGQPVMMGLGAFPIVNLARARDRAFENARAVENGGDPRRQQLPKMPTFADCLERTIEVLRTGWKNGKTEKNLRAVMDEYVLPRIGRKPIDAITPADVLGFLTPIGLEKPATAKKAKMGLSQTFRWAIAQGLRPDNPADQNINTALPKLSSKEHHKALNFREVGAAVQTVRDSGAWAGTKLAFEFLILTAARSGEVRGADWNEIDLDAALWTIPADRMKSGREHRIPLNASALVVLEGARELSDGAGLVFPSSRGKEMSDNTISKLLRENGIQAVPHGFRSSFRDWCAEHSIDRQIAESALAHTVGDATEAAYLRSDVLALRRAAMDAWGEFVTLQQS